MFQHGLKSSRSAKLIASGVNCSGQIIFDVSTFDKVSDEIKPHNKTQEFPQQSLIVLTFFYRKPFLLQFLQSLGTCSIREQRNFTNLVIQG